jgi:hypothetical protein
MLMTALAVMTMGIHTKTAAEGTITAMNTLTSIPMITRSMTTPTAS